MAHYWLIKSLLIVALIAATYLLVRPARTASTLALRRIGLFLILGAAVFAILFPGVFNRFALALGVVTGTNLLVYLLAVALFAQMATSYRRDAAMQARVTALAREVAIQNAAADAREGHGGGVEAPQEDDSPNDPHDT